MILDSQLEKERTNSEAACSLSIENMKALTNRITELEAIQENASKINVSILI